MSSTITRRSFIRSSAGLMAAMGVFGAGGWALGEEPSKTPYRSHGPWKMFKDNPRRWVADNVMPPPKGRKITDQLFVSTRLENVFYLDLGEHAVVIDAGYDHQAERHLNNFEELGLDLSKVRAILATHSHVDHTAGLKRAQDRLSVPVIAHRLAKKPIETGDKLQTAAVIPELEGWEFDFPPCKIDHFVDDGDELVIGGEKIRVVHIPGHTPDSAGYVWRRRFFTGDAIFAGGLVGWADQRWLSNYADHAESMQRLLDEPIAAEQFHCAHGPEFPYGQNVPAAVKKTLLTLTPIEEDPCNHTPKAARRSPDEQPQSIKLA